MKKIAILLCVTLLLQGCGTLLKPKQVNQPHTNKPDYKIVLLDGVGLVFFLIPGIVAYAVDYSNGTLYLSHGHTLSLGSTSPTSIQKALEKATGRKINIKYSEEVSRAAGIRSFGQVDTLAG